MEAKSTTYLLLGSNLGDRSAVLSTAISMIDDRVGEVLQKSSVVETEAWGFEAPSFLNQVVAVATTLSPNEVLKAVLAIELELGRTRSDQEGYQSRTIDLDMLLYENVVVKTEELELPHPRMHLRRFTLVPLAAIAPDVMHPIFQCTMRELLNECPDEGEVKVLDHAV